MNTITQPALTQGHAAQNHGLKSSWVPGLLVALVIVLGLAFSNYASGGGKISIDQAYVSDNPNAIENTPEYATLGAAENHGIVNIATFTDQLDHQIQGAATTKSATEHLGVLGVTDAQIANALTFVTPDDDVGAANTTHAAYNVNGKSDEHGFAQTQTATAANDVSGNDHRARTETATAPATPGGGSYTFAFVDTGATAGQIPTQ